MSKFNFDMLKIAKQCLHLFNNISLLFMIDKIFLLSVCIELLRLHQLIQDLSLL